MYKFIFTIILIFSFFYSGSIHAEKKYEKFVLENGTEIKLSIDALRKNDGYLVLEIDPGFYIGQLVLTKKKKMFAAYTISKVKNKVLHIVKLPVGRYKFSKLYNTTKSYGGYFSLNDDYSFDVKPGVINYPGELHIRETSRNGEAYIHLKNRSFRFMQLNKELLNKYFTGIKVQYVGNYDDLYFNENSLCCE